MFVVAAAVNGVLAAVLTSSAANIVTGEQRTAALLDRVRATGLRPLLAAVSLAGAVGLVVGLWVAPLGVAAGLGVIAFMVGALAAHLRVGDRNIAPPLIIGAVAIVATALRAATA